MHKYKNLENNNTYLLVFNKFLNLLMQKGKKNIARKILNTSLRNATLKLNVKDTKTVFLKSMFNVSPDVELKSKRVGSTTYQIPCAISVERKLNIGIKEINGHDIKQIMSKSKTSTMIII